MFSCPLCLDASICLDTTCMLGYSNMLGHPPCLNALLYVWMSPYVWTPPVCLDTPCMSGYPLYVWVSLCLDALLYVWTPPVYLDDVLMPPVHTQHKKACFVTLRECPYMPIHLDAPYFWMPLVCLNAPTCLDTPCMFGCTCCMFGSPNMFGCIPCMFGCPHMCSTAGNTFQPAAMFGCPLYILMPPCLDAPFMLGCPLLFGYPHMFGWPPL